MDLSPQDVRDVQFRSKVRGYHEDDVDQFLVQVASTLERLQLRLQGFESRAAGDTSRSEEIATTEESLKRTLLLAQRTADLALEEAREEAARLLDDARAEHEHLRTESAELKRQLIDESQEEIKAELAVLERRRDALAADVAALEGYVADQRSRLAAMLRDTLAHLEAGSFTLDDQPGLSEEPGQPPTGGPDEALPSGAATADAREHADAAADDGPPTEAIEALDGAAPVVEPAADDDRSVPAVAGAPAAVDLREGAPAAAEPGAGGEARNDAFLAELRRAATDEAPLGPRPDDDPALASDDEEIDFYQRDREVSGRLASRLRRRR